MTTPQVLTEEEYLTLHGANEHEICDPALHQPDWAGRSGAHKRALLKVNNKAWIEFRISSRLIPVSSDMGYSHKLFTLSSPIVNWTFKAESAGLSHY